MTVRRGLHLLGADGGSDTKSASSKTDYSPYVKAGGDAAGSIIKSIADGLRPLPSPQPPPPPEKSNTVWYVGGAAVLAILVAFWVRQ